MKGLHQGENEVLSDFNKMPPSDLADLTNLPEVVQNQRFHHESIYLLHFDLFTAQHEEERCFRPK